MCYPGSRGEPEIGYASIYGECVRFVRMDAVEAFGAVGLSLVGWVGKGMCVVADF